MALTTFGAIMGYAAELFRLGEESLRTAAQEAKDPIIREVLQDLLADQNKNLSLMERLRREYVTEMILEPIDGLEEKEYEINPVFPALPRDADLLRIAIMLKEQEIDFLQESSAKIPLPEVAKIFRKVAKRKELQLLKLKDMVTSQQQ